MSICKAQENINCNNHANCVAAATWQKQRNLVSYLELAVRLHDHLCRRVAANLFGSQRTLLVYQTTRLHVESSSSRSMIHDHHYSAAFYIDGNVQRRRGGQLISKHVVDLQVRITAADAE
jgi:hypothetical protein